MVWYLFLPLLFRTWHHYVPQQMRRILFMANVVHSPYAPSELRTSRSSWTCDRQRQQCITYDGREIVPSNTYTVGGSLCRNEDGLVGGSRSWTLWIACSRRRRHKGEFCPSELGNWYRAPERTAPAAETVTEAADDNTDAVGRRAAWGGWRLMDYLVRRCQQCGGRPWIGM